MVAVITNQETGAHYYMDGYLHDNLTTAKSVMEKDWDMVFLVDGMEGAGKSVFAQQIGYFIDPTLCLDRIVFTPEDFRKAILSAEKKQCVIYDEAYAGLSSRGTMSKINRLIIKMLTEIRRRNLFIIIVLPSIFILDKYVAIWRSRALVHVYTGAAFERGYFSFYNLDTKKELYMNGIKLYSYAYPRPNFHGRFYNHYLVDAEAYKNKKDVDTQKMMDDGDAKKLQDIVDTKAKIAYNLRTVGMTHIEIGKVMGCTRQTVYNLLKEVEP